MEFYIDNTVVGSLPKTQHGIKIDQFSSGNYFIEVQSLHVKVEFKLFESEFQVSVPYALYGQKLYGLCGKL